MGSVTDPVDREHGSCGRPRPAVSVSLLQLPPDQKAGGQHHGDRMAVKAWPQPALELVPAQLAVRLLRNGSMACRRWV